MTITGAVRRGSSPDSAGLAAFFSSSYKDEEFASNIVM